MPSARNHETSLLQIRRYRASRETPILNSSVPAGGREQTEFSGMMNRTGMDQLLKTSRSTPRPTGYLKQLDSVRTIAVAMVIATHWEPRATTFWFNGGLGVKLFFVLSGFLITGILLDARRQADRSGLERTAVLKSFYARRFLRIFPLFYATLALTFLLGVPTVREFIWWLIPYLGNVLLALRGEWLSGIAHFWSLAVEEQFYLVWPVLILFTPRRLLLPLIASAIVFAELFRLVLLLEGINAITVGVLPFASLDTLGLGALLALLWQRREGEAGGTALTALGVASIGGCLVFFALHIASWLRGVPAYCAWIMSVTDALTAFGAVWLTVRGWRGPLARLMNWAPLVYLGKVSYGLYILHPFMPGIVVKILRLLRLPDVAPLGPIFVGVLNLAALIGVCSLSWHFFEKKVNNLKRFFPYVSPAADKA
jgi:peptidoglycan/LPS O-acetylase OafA/YrhL